MNISLLVTSDILCAAWKRLCASRERERALRRLRYRTLDMCRSALQCRCFAGEKTSCDRLSNNSQQGGKEAIRRYYYLYNTIKTFLYRAQWSTVDSGVAWVIGAPGCNFPPRLMPLHHYHPIFAVPLLIVSEQHVELFHTERVTTI